MSEQANQSVESPPQEPKPVHDFAWQCANCNVMNHSDPAELDRCHACGK